MKKNRSQLDRKESVLKGLSSVIVIFREKAAESVSYISSNKSLCVFFPYFRWLTWVKTNTRSLKRLSSHQSLRIFRIEASEEATLMWKQRFAQQFKPLTTQTSPVYTWHNKRHEKQVFIRRGSATTSPKLIYKQEKLSRIEEISSAQKLAKVISDVPTSSWWDCQVNVGLNQSKIICNN